MSKADQEVADLELRRGLEVGMAEMGGPVDRAYLVSVEDLSDICTALTEGKREYKLTCEHEKKIVAIFYNDGPEFPIVANIWLLGGLFRRRPEVATEYSRSFRNLAL